MELRAFDSDYVERLTRGDPPTEQHFTAYFGELLLLKLRPRLDSPQLLEDAIQETFLRFFTILRQEGIDHPERLGAFVNAVANNVLREALRSETNRWTSMSEAGEPLCGGPSIETRLVSLERRQAAVQVLHRLPQRDLDLLRGIFLEKRDKDALCAKHGVGRQYLRVLLHRAVERARKMLERKLLFRPKIIQHRR